MTHGQAETAWVRESAQGFCVKAGFESVVESRRPGDGWRAEWIDARRRPPLVLLFHKPDGAPWLSIECVAAPRLPEPDAAGWKRILSIASEHELAAWREPDPDGSLRLSSRLPARAVEGATLEFWIGNLAACRDRLLEDAGGTADQ